MELYKTFRCLFHIRSGNICRLRRVLSTHANQSIKAETDEESSLDDKFYFKRLGKTTNHYWADNAEQVVARLDINRLIDPLRDSNLRDNLRRRYYDDKVDLQAIRAIWAELKTENYPKSSKERNNLLKKLVQLVLWVPNETHPQSLAIPDDTPVPVKIFGQPSSNKVLEFQKYCDKHNLLRNDSLGNIAFHRSYYLKGPLAELEEALVRFALDSLKKSEYQLISVPDVLYPHVIESCGMRTRSERDQVFWVELPDSKDSEVCLSGTAEMSIGGSLQNRIFSLSELPLKLAAVSRCFRAETSSVEEERGLYRVHDFTKVELFGVTAAETGEESAKLHEEIKILEEENFSQLGLHFKTLEMPPSELGLPAFRKFDIEAWMPGRKMFGEISSCSNCTDFQSRRLNIRYRKENGELGFVHTVNGTAIAVPRMLIALIETCQQADGSVNLPSALKKFMTRSWEDSLKETPQFKSTFLRTKSSQMKYTKQYRKLELNLE